MLQEASRRGPEIVQARTDATLADVTAERETKRWRTWLPVPVANLICLAVHWFVATTEPPVETRSYFVFLWNFLAVALLLVSGTAIFRLRCPVRHIVWPYPNRLQVERRYVPGCTRQPLAATG